jgi:radical SAM superfamily enzyme with C-terminal helix-hairpin-helix motif
VIVEVSGDLSFARPMGSYPILVGLPIRLALRTVLDAVVVDHGMRSVTALPVPVAVNTLPASALKWLPGLGKKQVVSVLARRPFKTMEEFRAIAGKIPLEHLITV